MELVYITLDALCLMLYVITSSLTMRQLYKPLRRLCMEVCFCESNLAACVHGTDLILTIITNYLAAEYLEIYCSYEIVFLDALLLMFNRPHSWFELWGYLSENIFIPSPQMKVILPSP